MDENINDNNFIVYISILVIIVLGRMIACCMLFMRIITCTMYIATTPFFQIIMIIIEQ
jgi:hypothetical protein